MEDFLVYIHESGLRMDPEFNGVRPEHFLWRINERRMSYDQIIQSFLTWKKNKLDGYEPYAIDESVLDDLYHPSQSLHQEYTILKFNKLKTLIWDEVNHFTSKNGLPPNAVLLYDMDVFLLKRFIVAPSADSYGVVFEGLQVVPCHGIHYLGKPRAVLI